ncbi:asialoglycoprotein receptor 2-like [Cetorhinus maximus]
MSWTWEESRQNCIAQGAELFVIRNRKEQKFVAGYDVQKVYWIGLNETAEGGSWKWVDGTDVQDELKFWDRGYPDNYFDYELEQFKKCGMIHNKAWANAACNQASHWICKRRAEKPPISL